MNHTVSRLSLWSLFVARSHTHTHTHTQRNGKGKVLPVLN